MSTFFASCRAASKRSSTTALISGLTALIRSTYARITATEDIWGKGIGLLSDVFNGGMDMEAEFLWSIMDN